MHSNESESAWLYCEGTDEQRELSGNRAGFEQLHSAIGDLLNGDSDAINFPNRKIGFCGIELRDKPPSHQHQSHHDRLVSLLIAAALISILLLALFGFIQLIHISFS